MNRLFATGLLSIALTGFTTGLLPGYAKAQSAGSGAVDIEASEMEIIDADKVTVFRGDVVAKRPTDTIRADKMTAIYVDVKQPDGTTKQEVDVLDCRGNVTIVTDTQTLTGDTAKFRVRIDKLEMSGDVKVVQGTTVIRGQKLVSDLNTKHTTVTGGRVKGKFVPK